MGGVKTFVVRLFVPAEPAPSAGDASFHGLVEEIGSTRSGGFADGEELLAFLATSTAGREAELSERSVS